MTIKDIIEEGAKDIYESYGNATGTVIIYKQNQSKLINHIIEMIDEIKPSTTIETAGERNAFLNFGESLKQKLLQELGESK